MHIQADRKALMSRIKRLQGQVEAIRKTVDEGRDEDSYAVLHLMMSARGAVDGLIRLFIEGHVREHLVGVADKKEREKAGEELIKSLQAFL